MALLTKDYFTSVIQFVNEIILLTYHIILHRNKELYPVMYLK